MAQEKVKKTPFEMKINKIMEISSFYTCIFLPILFLLSSYPTFLTLKEYAKNNYNHNLYEIIFVILGFSYSYSVLYICENYLINFLEPYFMEEKKRKNENKEGRKIRVANYLNGFLYYGSSTIFLFSQFYKTKLSPQFLGGSAENLDKFPFKPFQISTLQTFFYLFHLGHHIERLQHLIITSRKSASFYSMLYHHILTVLLIISSYLVFVGNYGFLIFFYYDTCEISLNFFRILREFKSTKGFLAHFFAIVFYVNWTVTRIYAFCKDLFFGFTIYIFFEEKFELHWTIIVFLYVCIFSLMILNVFWHYQITNALFLSLIKKSEKIPWEDTQIEIKRKKKSKTN